MNMGSWPLPRRVIVTAVFAQSPSGTNVQTRPRYLPEYTASGDQGCGTDRSKQLRVIGIAARSAHDMSDQRDV